MAKQLIEDSATIESIIQRAIVCRIGLSDGDQPYVVPVCFGYEDGVLYFHSSPRGKKMDILRQNSAVCVEFDVDQELVEADSACKWSVKYRSVIGFGEAHIVENLEDKRRALDVIMAHYGGQPGDYAEVILGKTAIVRVEIARMTAKVVGY